MIPTYETIMHPFLKILSDKKQHNLNSVVEELERHFKLTEKEKRTLTPSGQQPLFRNRVGWARTYLKKAELLTSPKRATYEITERGLNLLQEKGVTIDNSTLSKFSEFLDFKDSKKILNTEDTDILAPSSDVTPEEELEIAFQKLKANLIQELLEIIKTSTPSFFEKLVVDLLLNMGYGGSRKDAGEAIGKSNDGGIDGIIKEDILGLDIIYIQAKKWEAPVPVREIRDFAGALLSKKAKKGVFITTSRFPASAYTFVQNIEHKIILIDGLKLAEFMIEYGVGVAKQNTYEVKQIDFDYFE